MTTETHTRAPLSLHQAIAPITPGAVDRTRRTVAVVASSELVDRAGDRILADGWDLSAYRRNPVVLFAHRDRDPPIGRAIDISVSNGRLTAVLQFADAATYPFADQVFRLLADGYLNAVSVGFRPLAWSRTTDPARKGGKDISQQELLEISVAPVPCLPDARVVGRGVSSLSRLALARAIGRGVARAIQALKQGGRHDERHPAGSPGGVGGQFAPSAGGGGAPVSGGSRGRDRPNSGGSDGGLILVSGGGDPNKFDYKPPSLENLPDRVSYERPDGRNFVREVIKIDPAKAVPTEKFLPIRDEVIRHGLRKHGPDVAAWSRALSRDEYVHFFNQVISDPDRAAKLVDGRTIFEKAVGPNGARVVVIVNENKDKPSTMFAPKELPGKEGSYFDNEVGKNYYRQRTRTINSGRPRGRGRSMTRATNEILFDSHDLDADLAEHLFLMSAVIGWSMGGACGMVLDIQKWLPKSQDYFQSVAGSLMFVSSTEEPYTYLLQRDDLATIRDLMVYQRDVYDIEYEVSLVIGFTMEQFHETLRWVEAKLAELA